MIRDLETDFESNSAPADVCIVGAGAAGIVLAIELAKSGKRVLLLESGGRGEEPATRDLYTSELAGLRHTGIHEGRHRVYGGSTTRWGGQVLELFEDDFARRPWIEGSGWPIAKQELTSYYSRALDLQGLHDVTRDDREAWREVGLDLPEFGPKLTPFFSRWCREPNFTRLHGAALTTAENIEVVLHANAVEILLADDGGTVRGLRCRTLSGREAVFTARQYVFCLGGIETARFLLQAHAEGQAPWHRNEWLGRHFQDHLDVYCADLVDVQTERFHAYFDHVCRRGYRYEPRFRLTSDEQEKAGLLTVAGMVFFEDRPDSPRDGVWQTMKHLIRGRLREVSARDVGTLAKHLPLLARQMYRYQVQGRSFNPEGLVKFRLRVFCEQEPLGESRITLGTQKDALGHFRARLDWRISERELASVRRFVEVVRDSFAERQLARVVPDPDLMDNPDVFRGKVMDSYHHMGGARMAASATQGVVDLDLKIHGTRNAYVCSSAVFPASGFSNPTHTLLALAVRLADHLKDS